MHKKDGSSAVADSTPRKGFLTRLARDIRGNTLAIVGAALVPLAAMIGSGVDMSRAYMAKTRLQSACDAAALAGRRIMQNDQMTDAVRAEAVRFFNFNFRQGLYDTQPFTPGVTRPEAGTVRVTASTRIPTTIMKMFGFETLPLNVTCDASLNFVNTDVMLVLDVTGSMAQSLGGSQKIVALREAVMALYDELRPIQTQLEGNGLRLRYGVVPYSSTVNVGGLVRAVNPDYLSDDVDYQSRVARYDRLTYVGDPEPPSAPVVQVYPNSISQSNCDQYGRNVAFSGFSPSATSGGGPPPSPTWTRTFSNNEASGADWGWPGAPDTTSNTRSCRRRYVQTNTIEYETRYRWSGATYEQESVDVSQYKMGNTVLISDLNNTTSNDGNLDNDGYVSTPGNYDAHELAVATNGGNHINSSNARWDGCIEERETVNTITASSGYGIPGGAYDLNINLVPHDSHTRWRPMFPEISYRRAGGTTTSTSGNSTSAACPVGARRLAAWNRGDMESYVQSLLPVGNTYHDIGMIWGARMISNGGVFADSPDTFAGMPVSRHIIFMTDGQLEPSSTVYSSYGIEINDQRITGSSSASGQHERHMQRFKMICNAAKSMNVSIWVIAFGTTLSAEMLECASNSNQASTASNRDALIARFRQIGSNIGALRLTQ